MFADDRDEEQLGVTKEDMPALSTFSSEDRFSSSGLEIRTRFAGVYDEEDSVGDPSRWPGGALLDRSWEAGCTTIVCVEMRR